MGIMGPLTRLSEINCQKNLTQLYEKRPIQTKSFSTYWRSDWYRKYQRSKQRLQAMEGSITSPGMAIKPANGWPVLLFLSQN